MPDPAPISTEPLPIFASDRWRIAVVTSALAGDLPEAGLARRSNKEWLVVVLDVTNWSEVTNWAMHDAPLSLRDFTLSVDGVEEPFKTALRSTRSVAAELGTVAPSDELVLRITTGETSRVALVFQVPERGRLLALHHGETTFPLADTLSAELSPGALPPPTEAPPVEQGTIVSASDGRTMRVRLDGETEPLRIRLLGVTPPEKGACLEHGAEVLLDDLAGSTVLVETEPAIDEDSAERYVWLIGDDGRRTLLNHRLIAEGLAMADDMPDEAMAATWLSATERTAKSRKVGLWAPCT